MDHQIIRPLRQTQRQSTDKKTIYLTHKTKYQAVNQFTKHQHVILNINYYNIINQSKEKHAKTKPTRLIQSTPLTI